ncbi:MAG: hypothetical protein IPH60_08385 [Flavobacteriales bacterium]|nr:hypothetical protein [Flavobacteriales bacterium]
MKHYCTLLAAVFLSCQWSYAQPPRVDWGFPIDSDQFDYGGHVQSDAEGNIYVAGEFSGAVDMDSWEDEQWMLDPGPGGMSSFVAKYAGSGELVWAMALESNTSGEVANTIQDLVVSSDGTIHIVMEVNSGLDLNPLGSEVPIQAMTPTAQGFFTISYSYNMPRTVPIHGTSRSSGRPVRIGWGLPASTLRPTGRSF